MEIADQSILGGRRQENQSEARVRNCVPIQLGRCSTKPDPAKIYSFRGLQDNKEHVAIEFGDCGSMGGPPPVRVHSECLTGDVFGSDRCDCGEQLSEAIEVMNDTGGIILYLRQEGRGIGLYNKLDAYVLQDRGLDTYEANRELHFPDDQRDYTVASQMLRAMGHDSIRLLSNNPDKLFELEQLGIQVVETRRTGVFPTANNMRYLQAKVQHSGHTIELE